MKAQWIDDHSKYTYYKHSSKCHDAAIVQKMLWQGKIVTDPNFKIVTSGDNKVQTPNRKKWYQFWKPKYITRTMKAQNVKEVTYQYYCSECNKRCTDKWEFKHLRVKELGVVHG